MTLLRSALCAAVLSALVSACATAPAPREAGPAPFRAEDFAWSEGSGSNSVVGRIAYRDWTCAGGPVGLTPDTPYSRNRVARLYGSTEKAVLPVAEVRSRQVAEAGDDYSGFVRQTRCDEQGRYRFEGLPDGSWFLIGRARPAEGGEGVALMRRITVRGGQAVAADLS